MRLKVQLFAAAREAANGAEIEVEIQGARETTARAVHDLLSARGDALGAVARRSRIAVNQVFARPEQCIGPSDEIALIPPVGGG